MDTIVVVFIVGLAAGYLVWRYVKKAKSGGGCETEKLVHFLKMNALKFSWPIKH